VVNPMLVEGQIVGGCAQGIGGAMFEEFNYNADGQLLTGSFMDYLLPTACEIPSMQLIHQHSPSPLNPLGVKGVGESGCTGSIPSVANAIMDALNTVGVGHLDMPLTPSRVWTALQTAKRN
jgi:carbon-monoxide dehydrogenase large subunit